MAQRFGGKYSPTGAAPPPDGGSLPNPSPLDYKRAQSGIQVRLLFAAPLLFLVHAFGDTPRTLILSLVACGWMLLSAWLTRDGIIADQIYRARKVARRPALPRKFFGAVLTGGALAVGAMVWQSGPLYPVLIGLAGAALHLGAFGLDPMGDKGMEGVDTFQTDRVARAVTEAETHLAAMNDAILRASDRGLERRVEGFATIARALFRTVEGDPRDLTAARKYLSVYLMGARDATVKFADLYALNRASSARTEYEALLTDLETNFASRTRALLSDNHTDLDVEIAVLRDRLKLEG